MYSTLPIPMMQGGGDLMHGGSCSEDGTSGLSGLSGSPTDYMNDPNSLLVSPRSSSTTNSRPSVSTTAASLFMPGHSPGKNIFAGMSSSSHHRPRGRKPSHGGQSQLQQQMSPGLLDQQQLQQGLPHHLLQSHHPGSYVTVKSESGGSPPHSSALLMNDMFGTGGMSQLTMPTVMQQGDMLMVGQNMEVGNDGGPGDVILVSDGLRDAGGMDGGEVVVGGGGMHHHQLAGNEIVIDGGHHHHHQRSRSHMDMGGSSSAGSADDSEYGDSTLVIDTAGVRDDVDQMSGMSHHHHHHQQQQHHHHHHHHQQIQQHVQQPQQHLVGYECAECGDTCKSRGSLKKHIQKFHPQNPEPEDINDRMYACTTCTYQTQRRDKLDKHMAKHLAEGFSASGKKRGRNSSGSGGGGSGSVNNAFPQRMRHAAEEYKCPSCPYKCTVEKALKKHVKLHNVGNKHFVVKISCMVCGKDRSTETELRKHMKRHREGRDFTCDVCGFASVQLKKIIQHRRMHTGEKPHLCPHCTYRSSRRDNLRSHVRRMHKKENMYIDTFHPRADQQGGTSGPGELQETME